MDAKALSIIITSYNEEKTIAQVLDRVLGVPLNLTKDIIVVDGVSTDGTRKILQRYGAKYDNINLIFEDKREGKGAAIRKGLKAVKGDIVIFQDADLELDPGVYPGLIKPIIEDKADIVYGSRFKLGKGQTPIGSYIGNKIITGLINILYFKLFTDVATCYKVFKSSIIKDIKLTCSGFDFDAEFTCRVSKLKGRILEVPIAYNPRQVSDGKKLNWTAGLTSIKIIIKARFGL